MTASDDEPRDRMGTLLTLLSRVSTVIGSIIDNRTAQVVAVERREVRRAAGLFALAFTAAVFACAAAGFAAVAILTALGDEHRAVGSACIAAGFALLAAIAVLIARRRL
jgi:hypothetical protein